MGPRLTLIPLTLWAPPNRYNGTSESAQTNATAASILPPVIHISPHWGNLKRGHQVDVTVVSCHFGDSFWIRHLLSMLQTYRDTRIRSVVLVDQSRQDEHWLTELPGVDQVLVFPTDDEQVKILGHDHPTSLNRALAEASIETSHTLILDSDCFPTAHNWLDSLNDVTLASDPSYWSLSHPCFMFFPTRIRDKIDFSEGVAEIGMDTGRLVATQLARAGMAVNFSRPTPAFRGYRGHFYLDGRLYHHGSASFVSSPDMRISRQVNPWREQFFRRCIERGEYDFSHASFLSLRARGALDRTIRYLRLSS